MYFSALQGHDTSRFARAPAACPPSACTARTRRRPARRARARPMRVMIRMLTTTYGESLSSTPYCASGEPSGPMQKGMTYIVRPRMHPSNSRRSVCRISFGSTQLLVGPASCFRWLQMKVRSSTRATSLGSDRARKLLGRRAGLRRLRVPAEIICSQSRSDSAVDPSHQWIDSGCAELRHLRDPRDERARSSPSSVPGRWTRRLGPWSWS